MDERVILHCDLNNFYASVECFTNPKLRGMPIAVCGSQDSRHGIVLAKNYLAKNYGITTGEPIWKAKNKCPKLLIVPPNYNLYLDYSNSAKEIYKSFTNLVEPFGIDECWLDITSSTRLFGTGEDIAKSISNRIKTELGITLSIGVSFNKIFSKFGSDMKKPDAITTITKTNFKQKIWKLPVEDLLYVGFSSKKKLNTANISTIGDLASQTPKFLSNLLGKWGYTLWNFANGYDESEVCKYDYQPIIKSVGNSLTSPKDLTSNNDAKFLIYVLSESVGERLRKYNLKGNTIHISIRDTDMFYIERQQKLNIYTNITSQIAKYTYNLFLNSWNFSKNIRALGVRVSGLEFESKYSQLSLFEDVNKQYKLQKLDSCIDNIRERFGHYSLQRANLLTDKDLNKNPIEENIIFPVSYFK